MPNTLIFNSSDLSLDFITAEPCHDAKATSKIYSTSNVLLASESVFLVESTVKCSNNPKVGIYIIIRRKGQF